MWTGNDPGDERASMTFNRFRGTDTYLVTPELRDAVNVFHSTFLVAALPCYARTNEWTVWLGRGA